MSAMKRLLVLVFSTTLALACMPSIATAVGPPVPLDSPSKTIVSGTTYTIGNASELTNLAAIVNGTGGAAAQNCTGATFILTSDIVLTGPWVPIGSDMKPFLGAFDGRGFEISGINVSGAYVYAGLFGYITGSSVIRNTGVSGSVSSSATQSRIGGIAGANYDGIVYNCHFAGVVSASGSQAYAAGIVGDNFSSGIIRSCYNIGSVNASGIQSYIGGIAGRNDFSTIENCFNNGGILGTTACYTGGIAAHCFAGPVRNCYNIGIVAGGTYVGYIIGYNASVGATNCYWLDMPGAPMGSGSTSGVDIVSFAASGGGTLMTAVTIPGYSATSSLLDVLNNWDEANSVYPDLRYWGVDSGFSPYPVFAVLWTRLAGADRFDTMECIVEDGFDSADTVIIATGFNYPDALAASGLAGGYHAPILLTDGTHLSPQAGAALLHLNPSHAIIVGGDDVVSSDVASQVEALLGKDSVRRASGIDRVGTAISIFNEGEVWSATAIIATGYGFADALSISPFAYATMSPIFLTGSNTSDTALSQETIDAIHSGGFTSIILVGGESVVSEEVKTQLGSGYAYERLSGIDRYQTSAAIADFAVASGVVSYDGMGVATGANFPDALAGGAFCGERGSVLLLADDFNDESRYCIDTCIATNALSLKKGYFFGGDDVVTLELEAKIMTACRYWISDHTSIDDSV